MSTKQIGVQMYTLRDHCKTSEDLDKTCKRVAEMGFGVIQASAIGPIQPEPLKQILDSHGLTCAATHRSVDQLKDVEKTVAEHKTLGCGLTSIGGFGFNGTSREPWEDFAREYNELAQRYEGTGVRIGYHNHSHEWSPFGLEENPAEIDPKQTPMHLLLDTLKEPAWFEMDTYWIAHGGGDPVDWIRKCKGRIPAVHVKDLTITPKKEHKMCEVGLGNLNWPAILEACRDAGVEYYLIERDEGYLDPFKSLEISLKNLRSWGLD